MEERTVCNFVSIRQLDAAALRRIKLSENKVRGSFRFFFTSVSYNEIRPLVTFEFPNIRGSAIFSRNSLVEALCRSRTLVGELLLDQIPVPWAESKNYDVRLLETTYREYVPREKVFSSIAEAREWLAKEMKEEQLLLKECIESTAKYDDDLPAPLRAHAVEGFGFYIPTDLKPAPAPTPQVDLTDDEEQEEVMRLRAEMYRPGPPDPILEFVKATKGLKIFEVAFRKKDGDGWKSFSTSKVRKIDG